MSNEPQKSAQFILALAARLRQLPNVNRLVSGGDEEIATLAHAVADIAESSEKITLLTRQLSSAPPSETILILEGIREELRHVIYHVKDTSYFQIIVE